MKRLLTVLSVAVTFTLGPNLPAIAHQSEARHQWTLRTEGYRDRQEWKERVREERREREAAARAVATAAPVEIPVVDVPSPPVSPGCLSAAQVAAYARAAGFPESVISTMVAIAYRESHYCPGAVNPSSGACGLWQLYPCPGSWALTPAGNAAGAYAKYAASGLSPWGY